MNPSTTLRLAQALSELLTPSDPTPVQIASARYVTIALAASKTGLTEKAIRRKIEDRVWLERQLWVRGEDGHIFIDMEGFEKWVEKGAASKSAPRASVSRSS